MNCAEVRERMTDFVYSELSGEVRSAVEEHLIQCAACRDELAMLRRVHGLLEEAAKQDGGASHDKLSLLRVSDRALRRLESNRRRWQWLSALSVSALAVMLVLYAFSVRIEFHQSHIVLSWNDNTRTTIPAREASDSPGVQTQLVAHQLRLDDLDKTVHLLIQLTSADDHQRDREAILFAKQLQSLRAQNDTRWRTIAYVMGQLQPSFEEQTTFPTRTSRGEQP